MRKPWIYLHGKLIKRPYFVLMKWQLTCRDGTPHPPAHRPSSQQQLPHFSSRPIGPSLNLYPSHWSYSWGQMADNGLGGVIKLDRTSLSHKGWSVINEPASIINLSVTSKHVFSRLSDRVIRSLLSEFQPVLKGLTVLVHQLLWNKESDLVITTTGLHVWVLVRTA